MSAYKSCPSCLEQVLSTNFLLHSLYCERNIVQCELCDQRIDLNEKEDHMYLHQKKACPYCQENYEQQILEKHQISCPNKPLLCCYCDLMINQLEMVQHQVKCGARTEQCPLCKKHIQKKEFDIHVSICQLPSPSSPKRARLQQVLCDSSDDHSVQEVKQNPQNRRPLKKEPKSYALKQKKEQKDQKQPFQKPFLDDDEDEELQKALYLCVRFKALHQQRHLSHPIYHTPKPQLQRSFSLPKFFVFNPRKQFHGIPQKMRRKSCDCKECGQMTNFQYRNMNVPFILKPFRIRRQPSLKTNRLLTAQNTKKLFRKFSASKQDTLICTSSSQLILTSLRRASARTTEKLIEDTQVRIFEPPKSCKSHLLQNTNKPELTKITLQIPKSQRIIKTQPSEHSKIKLPQNLRSLKQIYNRNFLCTYLTKYKKSKTQINLSKY
ncbi:unnamed protein product [Paramecium octaurelia]|uniref:TRAF-type domain-containing protein n=1 Tax=Paramecium octaurelia TaxID=43137 RepID=A0A8S1XVY0_PAROT|nr:unnamed protein product [Paramecium octaurelia]